MKIVKVKNTDTNLELPAELRVYSPEQVVVLIKEFETAKLIKKDSKAPPSMIRQMYTDYMTMKHKAL
jgi:hypothetical protein